jgi:hypothetical protein
LKRFSKYLIEKNSVSSDILPKSGAGQQGTDTVRKTYQRMTPGQPVTSFTDYIKTRRK